MDVSTAAPGKVILLGEYSVLEGGPALAMAVSREARVDINQRPDSPCTVCSPTLGLPPARFMVDSDGGMRWLDDEHRYYRLVQSVVATLSKYHGLPQLLLNGLDIRLDSSAMFLTNSGGRRTKMGLGSSAALTTALAWALMRCGGAPDWSDERWLTLLTEAHRLFQNGQGSGVDVAASYHGGVIEYKKQDGRPGAKRITLPSGLELAFVWSGRSASTPDLLCRLRSWRQAKGADYEVIMNELGQIVSRAAAAAASGDSGEFVGFAGRFSAMLAELGERAALEIFSPPHLELAAMAKRSGLVYKPCGAGGGDLGVAMGTDVSDKKQFIGAIRNSNYQVVDITPSPEGVRTIGSQ